MPDSCPLPTGVLKLGTILKRYCAANFDHSILILLLVAIILLPQPMPIIELTILFPLSLCTGGVAKEEDVFTHGSCS